MSTILNAAFVRQRRSLLGTVLRIVRDRETAEDLAQEAYLRARKAAESGPIEHVEPFLHQTARNLALDHLRRRRTRERHETPAADPEAIENIAADTPSIETELIERERLRLFERAMQALPERARRAWALSFLEGWSYARIAEHLGVSRNTVYNDVKLVMGHCHDAIARLERESSP
jgi:RNA polymerase sigma-70 factor (ECF subfamily)